MLRPWNSWPSRDSAKLSTLTIGEDFTRTRIGTVGNATAGIKFICPESIFFFDTPTVILPGGGCLYRQSSFSGNQWDLRCGPLRISILAGIGVSSRSRKLVPILILLYHNGTSFNLQDSIPLNAVLRGRFEASGVNQE